MTVRKALKIPSGRAGVLGAELFVDDELSPIPIPESGYWKAGSFSERDIGTALCGSFQMSWNLAYRKQFNATERQVLRTQLLKKCSSEQHRGRVRFEIWTKTSLKTLLGDLRYDYSADFPHGLPIYPFVVYFHFGKLFVTTPGKWTTTAPLKIRFE